MEESNNNSKKLYLAIIGVLLLINGIALYLYFKESKDKEQKVEQIAKMDTDYKSLTTEFESAKAELEGMKGKNAELDAIIVQRQQEIETLQKQFAAAQKAGTVDVAKYKNLLAVEQKKTVELQEKIKELESKNEELTATNLQVNKDLEKEKQTTTSLTEEKNKLTDEKAILSQKVELGSLLEPKNIKIEGVHKRSSGKEVAKKSAKNVDYLKISFETGVNKVLPKGNQTLYLRVINPKGETISMADKGGGKLKLAESGQEVQYTKPVSFDWTQDNKTLIIEQADNIHDKGNYKVEIYQSGYLVGEGSVELK